MGKVLRSLGDVFAESLEELSATPDGSGMPCRRTFPAANNAIETLVEDGVPAPSKSQ